MYVYIYITMYNPILKFSALLGQISNSSLKVDMSGTPNHDVVLMFLAKIRNMATENRKNDGFCFSQSDGRLLYVSVC